MLDSLQKAFRYEIRSITHSWYKILLISFLPLFVFWFITSVFQHGVLRDLPLTVVDNDHSKLSELLLRNIEASPTIHIVSHATDIKEALYFIKKNAVYGVVIIPSHFEKDIFLQKKPQVTAMLNTQYILIGKILTSALNTVSTQSAAQIEFFKHLYEAQDIHTSLSSIIPIDIQITPFFNTYKNYYYFLVSALLPAIWQIFIVIAMLVSIGTLFKSKQTAYLFDTSGNTTATLIGMMLPYTLSFTLMGIGFVLYLFSHWVFQGSLSVLILGIFLTTVAYQIIALLLFSTVFDYARSLSLGAVYTAPAFAFLGITFPIYNMNGFALFWRDILPVSHYTQLQISQANYGINVWHELGTLGVLLSFWLLFIPVVWRFKHKLKGLRA